MSRLEDWLAYTIHGRRNPIKPRFLGRRARQKPWPGREPRYLAFVRTLPCLVCYADFWVWWLNQEPEVRNELAELLEMLQVAFVQKTPTEAAHLGFSESRRGLSQKFPDCEAGPLCNGHHQTFIDAHHQASAGWWERTLPGLDRNGLLKGLYRVYLHGAGQN